MNQSAPLRYATLCLGTRNDAAAWEQGCESLGFTKAYSCIKAEVTPADVLQCLGTPADWVFMAGHSGGDDLYGEGTKPHIKFSRDAIVVYNTFSGTPQTVKVGDPTFKLRSVQVVVFAGCAPFTRFGGCAPILRVLFGNAAILGTSSLTGPTMMKTMFAGIGAARGFFGNYASNGQDAVKAWMSTAQAIYGGGPPMPNKTVSVEDNFRALDASGKHWAISDKKIVPGPAIQ